MPAAAPCSKTKPLGSAGWRLGFGSGGGGLGPGRRLGTGHRLLLMAGAPAQHRIEPQPHEQGDHRQQHDLEGQVHSPWRSSYIGAKKLRFKYAFPGTNDGRGCCAPLGVPATRAGGVAAPAPDRPCRGNFP